jgi:hypothetical protein
MNQTNKWPIKWWNHKTKSNSRFVEDARNRDLLLARIETFTRQTDQQLFENSSFKLAKFERCLLKKRTKRRSFHFKPVVLPTGFEFVGKRIRLTQAMSNKVVQNAIISILVVFSKDVCEIIKMYLE